MVTSKAFWNAYNFSFEFFFTIKNFFTNIAPRRFYNNWMWIATWFSFFPILCVLSKSANNTSSFSSSLNNFKTLSSVISIFSSFNPWIKMQFLLEYCSCLYIFFSRSSTFILAVVWRVAIIASFLGRSFSYSSNVWVIH